ncbi:MAG: hypothetical protein ABSG08_01090 [Terriglobales bacterium]|jgi:hypothetical protein
MSRPRRCAICAADPAIKQQIDSLLSAGVSIKSVVEQVAGYSRDQVSRHKHRCLQPQPVTETTEPESTTVLAERWLARADATYQMASVNGDPARMVSAISAATRALTQLDKRKAAAALAAEKASDGPGLMTAAECDRLLKEFRLKHDESHCYYCGQPWPKKEQEKTTQDALAN